jgi:hypothetical protein
MMVTLTIDDLEAFLKLLDDSIDVLKQLANELNVQGDLTFERQVQIRAVKLQGYRNQFAKGLKHGASA